MKTTMLKCLLPVLTICAFVLIGCDSVGDLTEEKGGGEFAAPDLSLIEKAVALQEKGGARAEELKATFTAETGPTYRFKDHVEFFQVVDAMAVVAGYEGGSVSVHENLKSYLAEEGGLLEPPVLAFVSGAGKVAIGDTLYTLAKTEIVAENLTDGGKHTYDIARLRTQHQVGVEDAAGKVRDVSVVEWSPIYVYYGGSYKDGWIRLENKTYSVA